MSSSVAGVTQASSSLALILLALFPASHARAQTTTTTTISSSQSTPVSTSTDGNITVGSAGSINVGTGAAITINSENSVDNEGTISINDGKDVAGILVTTGGGTTTNTITNGGSITITDSTLATTIPLTAGTQRYGIEVNSTSAYDGSVTNTTTGVITVRGNQSDGIFINQGGITGSIESDGTIGITGDGSFGILTNATVGGGIVITNSITALGTGSGGVQVNAAVDGQIDVSSVIRSTGYYNGEVTLARPSTFTGVTAINLLQGGPAVSINANVGLGIIVDTGGELLSLGSAPALQIAPTSTQSADIGVTSGGNAGLLINGVVNANGIYDTISTTAIQVGGGGGAVLINGGINVTDKVSATSFAANATGITIGADADAQSLVNSGKIESIVNFGQGNNALVGGTSTAVLDNGGALASITNSGAISATSVNGSAIALDLRGDTEAVVVSQVHSLTTTAASITGDILFGSNGGTLNLDAGTIAGNVAFGDATNNALTINNGAILGGAVTQAAGGELALSVVSGRLASSSISNLTLSSLSIGSTGQIDFAVNPTTGQNGSATVVGAILVSSGAKIGFSLDSQLLTPQTFTVIQTAGATGALVGQAALQLGDVPYFYNAQVITDSADGTVALQVRDRTFAEAGVLGSQSAYDAVFKANYADPGIRDAFNAAGTQQGFNNLYRQMLPSYSGGLFEVLSQGADAVVHTQAGNPLVQTGNHGGGWAQQFGFGAVQSTDSAPGFHGGGLGFAFGWETPASTISTLGLSVSYMRASVDDFDAGPKNENVGTIYAVGTYWREVDGGLRTDASINVGLAELNSERNFDGTDLTGAAVQRTADAAWTGGVAQAHLGISYEEPVGDFFVKPSVSGDYFVLYEGSHTEHNGGEGFDLRVGSETGKQGSVTGGLTLGMQFGDRDFTWQPEVSVGYKQVFGGPDAVIAQFAGGSTFTLNPKSQQGGPIAHIGIHGGNKYSDFALEAGAEDRGGYKAFDGRATARFQF